MNNAMNLSILLQGFALSFSLFAAIGAQNVFVLKQGIMKNHILAVCLVCIACDVVLIALGVFGVAGIFSQNPYLTITLGTLGTLFVLSYGLLALKSAFKTKALKSLNPDSRTTSLSSIILQTLAITLLNPHVYIDTIVVIGAYSLTLDSAQKIIFYVGAMSASLLWFASLGFFSHKARMWFQTPKTWAIIDFITALIMFGIAYGLWRFTLAQLSLI
ncbi:LysE/ArgO family amino acid transporter [Helicobacter pullorum]